MCFPFFFSVMLLGRKSGVLTVKILELHEECTMQVAMCEQLAGPPTTSPPREIAPGLGACLKVLFTRETADHLRGLPQDIIYIFPPWWVQQAESDHQLCICLISGRHFYQEKFSDFVRKMLRKENRDVTWILCERIVSAWNQRFYNSDLGSRKNNHFRIFVHDVCCMIYNLAIFVLILSGKIGVVGDLM